jgi:hypothetical protein
MPSKKFIIPAVLFVFVLQGLAFSQAQKPAHPLLGTGLPELEDARKRLAGLKN